MKGNPITTTRSTAGYGFNGGGGADRLTGGSVQDKLVGGEANDILDGMRGSDVLIGGPGKDTCYFDRKSDRLESCEIKRFRRAHS
jgi:Ca2+-binding RTX toxin-like protein